MGEITRKHERKPTDGIGILRTGFSRRTLLAGAVGALGLLLTGKALAEEPKKPLTVAKGPAPASVGETKVAQARECSTATTMEDLKKFDEETNSRGYRNEVSVPYEGKLVTGRMTNGRRFGAIIITESATLGLTVSKKGTDGFGVRNSRATGIPLSELNEVFGEVRLIVEDRAKDELGGYFQVFAVPVSSHGAKPDYNRTSLPFVLVGLDLRTDELYVSKGTICGRVDVTLAAPRK
ncbi:MAG: hypothetical protein AABW86_06385, partial [Candidatus Micrarchaeota archaeon]